MDASKENYKTLESMVSTRQHEYFLEGLSSRDSRIQAAAEVGASLTPPMGRDELESWLAAMRWEVRREGNQKDNPPIVDRYRIWSLTHDHLASDHELAFWCGCSRQAFGYARRTLKEENFNFEKNGDGWLVTSRPEIKRPKTYTEQEFQEELQTRLEQLGKEITQKFMSELNRR